MQEERQGNKYEDMLNIRTDKVEREKMSLPDCSGASCDGKNLKYSRGVYTMTASVLSHIYIL